MDLEVNENFVCVFVCVYVDEKEKKNGFSSVEPRVT
jgi:hypothetical protein